MSRRLYTVNENYFSLLTPDSCYWAGFIAADGYISPIRYRKNGGVKARESLRIDLSEKDKSHLESFKRYINYTGPIREYTTNVGNPYCSLQLDGVPKLVHDLNSNFNITTKKSLTLLPPELDEENILPFIAGYFDGDGTLNFSYRGNRRDCNVSFVGTKPLLSWIKNWVDINCPPPIKKWSQVNTSPGNYFVYGFSGKRAEAFAKLIEDVNIPRLERKMLYL